MESTEFFESKFVSEEDSLPPSYLTNSVSNSETTNISYCDNEVLCPSQNSYKANDNYGIISPGSLVFIDLQGAVRSLYNTAEPYQLKPFDGFRFIAASHSLDHFTMVRTKTVSHVKSTKTKVVLEQLDNKLQPKSSITLESINNSNVNYAVNSVAGINYVVGNGNLWVVLSNGLILLHRRLPLTASEDIQLVAGRLQIDKMQSFYTAGKVHSQSILHNIKLAVNLGYILHMSVNGVVNQLVVLKASKLSFRGMYYFNQRLYITGSYKGQLQMAYIFKHNIPDFTTNIAKCLIELTGFLLIFNEQLELLGWRLFYTHNPIMGDVTCNQLNQVFTSCRFKSSLSISEYNSVEIAAKLVYEDEALALLAFDQANQDSKKNYWWRILPVGLPADTVSDYISITNNGYDILLAGYSDASLSDQYDLQDHYFLAAFTPKLHELYYLPINKSTNRYNSRIIAMSKDLIFTGGTSWHSLSLLPFGLLGNFTTQSGYYLGISLSIPKLVGIVVDRQANQVEVQFKGETNIFLDAKVSRNYYINMGYTTEQAATLSTHNLNNSRYYSTAIREGLMLINQ